MKIALAQLDFLVGDLVNNQQLIIDACHQLSIAHAADIIVFPELALTGYPPEDLLFKFGFQQKVDEIVNQLISKLKFNNLHVLFGHPWYKDDQLYNAISWVNDGMLCGRYFKQKLPNYAVFDEKRYFTSGDKSLVCDINGAKIGILICEDIWYAEPIKQIANECDLIIVPNASPFHVDVLKQREKVILQRYEEVKKPILYLNLVGGQDELVFDGNSFGVDVFGKLLPKAKAFTDEILIADFDQKTKQIDLIHWPINTNGTDLALIYNGLIRGLQDYVKKVGFSKVILGLSGGIDSALVLAIAADALGAENVEVIMMPSCYTATMSNEDAIAEADALNVSYRVIPINAIFDSYLLSLKDHFSGLATDITEENLQARIRGTLLMALSNKFNALLLTTGNKSELGVGFATIYGDMCGGFAPIKDCCKTLVYELAHYRNSLSQVIPARVIERAPSAELTFNQTDQDRLPSYELIDAVIKHCVEHDETPDYLITKGFNVEDVYRVINLIQSSEYKRRQAAPGIKITKRAFGKDWRYPIASGWLEKTN